MNDVSLRDYFAAKAMQSYLLDTALIDGYVLTNMDVEEELAKRAYQMADAMLEARENR